MTSRSKGVSKTQWYDQRSHHDRQDPNRLNSRHSLETDEDISTDSDDDIFAGHQQENSSSVSVSDHHDGLMNKLFHSTPTLSKNSKKYEQQQQVEDENENSNFRGRAPTNEKLEKYKFMLINIEPDADILDPGTFALAVDGDEEEDSYLGFEFNDYPSEVLYSSYQHHPIPPHPSAACAALSGNFCFCFLFFCCCSSIQKLSLCLGLHLLLWVGENYSL